MWGRPFVQDGLQIKETIIKMRGNEAKGKISIWEIDVVAKEAR